MKKSICVFTLLLTCLGTGHAQTQAPEPGAYLSAAFGNGRIQGVNDSEAPGSRSMAGRAFEIRAGREQATALGPGRIDFVHYNEGHPDNNYRDGFALQWVAVRPLGDSLSGELGIGPYLSMNTTTVDGRESDDSHLGLLVGAALRLPLHALPAGTHLRLGVNHAFMPGAPRSTAILFGIGRQFGPVRPDPATEPAAAGGANPWWFGASLGKSITNLSGTPSANAGVLEAKTYLDGRLEHWALSAKLVWEGDDGNRVDRDGVAVQAWYVQQVTPGFSISAGAGPYIARNDRDGDGRTRANMLISLQAEHALSRGLRVFANFNRVKTFRQTNERDLLQLGLLKRF